MKDYFRIFFLEKQSFYRNGSTYFQKFQNRQTNCGDFAESCTRLSAEFQITRLSSFSSVVQRFHHPPRGLLSRHAVSKVVSFLGIHADLFSPYLGQGVAQAVEDVIAITAVLCMIKSKEQLPLAIRAYETSRKGRVEEIQAASHQAKQQLHCKDKEAQESRDNKRVEAIEANQNSDVVKVQQSYWVWDAAEAARRALSDIMVAA